MGWMIRVLEFNSRRGLGIFLFTSVSRTALGPTQPLIQWVPGSISLGVKRPGHESDHSPPSSAKVKGWVELYIHSPNTPSWRGARFKKSTETTLSYRTLSASRCEANWNRYRDWNAQLVAFLWGRYVPVLLLRMEMSALYLRDDIINTAK